MIKKDRDLCRIWDIVCEDHPNKSDEFRAQVTLDLYELETKDVADNYDLFSALAAREDER